MLKKLHKVEVNQEKDIKQEIIIIFVKNTLVKKTSRHKYIHAHIPELSFQKHKLFYYTLLFPFFPL